MDYLRIGIAVLVIGLILSLLPTFGFAIASTLIYLGWILIVVGIVLAALYYFSGSNRRSGGRTN